MMILGVINLNKNEVIEIIKQERLITIIRENNKEIAKKIIDRLIESGIKIVEITMNSDSPIELINYIKGKYSNIIVGVGTVLDLKTLNEILNYEVDFIVSPILNKEFIKICNSRNILFVPGVATLNEIYEGWKEGVKIFKLFPSFLFKPSIIDTYRSVIKDIEIMPTGGINISNAKEWLEAGAIAIGIGNFISKEAKETGDYSKINNIVKKLQEEL